MDSPVLPVPTGFDVATRVEALTDLLGISRRVLVEGEMLDPLDFTVSYPIDTAHLATVAPEELADALSQVWASAGPHISVTFVQAGTLAVFGLTGPVDEETIEPIYDAAAEAALQLTIVLDKKGFVAERFPATHAEVVYLLFAESLAEVFALGPTELERSEVLKPFIEHQRIVCLVGGDDLALVGDHLVVLGGDRRTEWGRHDAPPLHPDAPASVYEQAVDVLHWVRLALYWLTPLHLAVRPDGDFGNSVIARSLFAKWLDLCVIYLADETRVLADGTPTARCGAERLVASIELSRGDDLWRLAERTNAWPAVPIINGLVTTVYLAERRDADRVHVVQGVIAQLLQHGTAQENYTEIVRRAVEISEHNKWAWVSYVEQKLDQYFARVRELNDLVAETKTQHRQQLSDLRAQVVDSAKATVAVVVTTFIAAVFADDFNDAIFRLGVLVYAAYLALVPGYIGLTSLKNQFCDTRKMYANRAKAYEERLNPLAIERVLGAEATAEADNFMKWYRFVGRLYAVMVVALLVAAVVVPLWI